MFREQCGDLCGWSGISEGEVVGLLWIAGNEMGA